VGLGGAGTVEEEEVVAFDELAAGAGDVAPGGMADVDFRTGFVGDG
jgi:hypothetical protein